MQNNVHLLVVLENKNDKAWNPEGKLFTRLLGIRWHHINAEEETASHSPKFKDKRKAT